VLTALSLLAFAPSLCWAADQTRQDDVRARSAEVMPFDMGATTHVFTKTPTGGVQRVVAKNAGDLKQIKLVRAHLKDIADKFSRGDFSGPRQVHGAAMPGLAELQAAPSGDLQTLYRDIKSGAEIRYTSVDPKIVAALHEWFDAQH